MKASVYIVRPICTSRRCTRGHQKHSQVQALDQHCKLKSRNWHGREKRTQTLEHPIRRAWNGQITIARCVLIGCDWIVLDSVNGFPVRFRCLFWSRIFLLFSLLLRQTIVFFSLTNDEQRLVKSLCCILTLWVSYSSISYDICFASLLFSTKWVFSLTCLFFSKIAFMLGSCDLKLWIW